uniref:Ig-like domain-containing protein n=1 Tax=Macrostomum lignano TaxID=282301 RepID=A0A1I8GQH7_9PLAT
KPPNPKYEVAERTFVNGKRQWFYCYDVDAIPTARVWWEVWDKNATTIPGITLVDEGVIGNRSYSNITFVMDKHEHQLPFTCNAKNDVGHKTKIINMRYESTDYDPLRLKIIVQNTYNMMYKVQNDSHDVTDIVYSPMGQFGMADDGYKDPGVYIFCHMTGNPYGTELELVHNNPMSSSDVPDLIKQCNKMQVMANIVFCPLGKYEQYADFKWQCRAKQANPNTGKITTYTKKLDFVKVPSKIKIRLQYYNKWYGYDERDLRGGRLSEIPYPHRYEFYILGQDGLPHYASPAGNTLTLTDIPETLDNKEIICFVRPQNDSDIATKGIGQRYFKVTVFTMPEKPSILVTMKDSMDPSLIIRNPDTIELRRNGPAVELTCTLQNYDTGVDRTFGEDRYLDWVKCKNYKCLYAERIAGTTTEVSSMQKSLEGNKATLMVQTSSVMNSGIFMCVAVRPFTNVTGDQDYQMQSVPVKALVLTKPGEGDGSRKYGVMKITKTASGDIEFDCFFVGYPYPDLEIIRYDMDNRNVRLENPKWIRQIEEAYYDDANSHRYGSQLVYKLPTENIGPDKAKGTYVCTAENSLGKDEAERTWDVKRSWKSAEIKNSKFTRTDFDWAWRFCLPFDSPPPRFRFLPEFTQSLLTARLSQPRSSHLYVNFRCLGWSLQAELLRNRAPEISFDAWVEELQEDPDLEELQEDPDLEELEELQEPRFGGARKQKTQIGDPELQEDPDAGRPRELQEDPDGGAAGRPRFGGAAGRPRFEELQEDPDLEELQEDPDLEELQEDPDLEELQEDPDLEELQEDPDLEELQEDALAALAHSDSREHVKFCLEQMKTIRDERLVAMESQDEEKIRCVTEKLERLLRS